MRTHTCTRTRTRTQNRADRALKDVEHLRHQLREAKHRYSHTHTDTHAPHLSTIIHGFLWPAELPDTSMARARCSWRDSSCDARCARPLLVFLHFLRFHHTRFRCAHHTPYTLIRTHREIVQEQAYRTLRRESTAEIEALRRQLLEAGGDLATEGAPPPYSIGQAKVQHPSFPSSHPPPPPFVSHVLAH